MLLPGCNSVTKLLDAMWVSEIKKITRNDRISVKVYTYKSYNKGWIRTTF